MALLYALIIAAARTWLLERHYRVRRVCRCRASVGCAAVVLISAITISISCYASLPAC
jgi:hypothetical protein